MTSSNKFNCPVCGNNSYKILYEVTNEQSAKHFIPNQSSKKYTQLSQHLLKLWGKNKCQVLECQNCGFGYANPYMGGDKIFYDLAYQRTGYPKWKFEFEETFNSISKIIENTIIDSNSQLNFLEIGAGDGSFTKKILSKLPSTRITATEYSEYGIEQLKKMGITVYPIDFRQKSEEWSQKFSIVCLFQVLEHLDNMEFTFNVLNSITKNKAHLFISVPNQKFINFNESNGALLDMPPNHIGRYNKKTFELIAEKFGWTINDYKVEDSDFELFLNKFTLYKYLRDIQNDNTIENFLSKNKIIKKISLPFRLYYLKIKFKKLIFENYKEVGGSALWVHLMKN